jgi:hypothetical protein
MRLTSAAGGPDLDSIFGIDYSQYAGSHGRITTTPDHEEGLDDHPKVARKEADELPEVVFLTAAIRHLRE